MLVLLETPAGFALFKVLKEKKLKQVESLAEEFSTADKANKLVKLQAFHKFADSKAALKAALACVKSKMSKSLKSFLQNNIVNQSIEDSLIVCDKKLRGAIEEKLGISCLYSSKYIELIRGIRSQLENLVSGLTSHELQAMSLGLAHQMSRYTLKFSADKVDIMVVQAVSLLDDIDKELNNYAMRLKEWYSWHFPELSKIISDNIVYAKCVKLIGDKLTTPEVSFGDLIPEELRAEICEAAELSMGTEMTTDDLDHILYLCDQVIALAEYRVSLAEYLKSRMTAIAPNLTILVGELVGARLIAHAGSLVNLAKHPSSTVQILGAEKALFRAMRMKSDTPKYGLLYHASMVGQASTKVKGKISRSLAAKCSLSVRVDALGEQTEATVGQQYKDGLEARMRYLEANLTPSAFSGQRVGKYVKPKISEYNPAADQTDGMEKRDDGEEAPKKRPRTS
jgi:nucleolar protein 58